MSACLGVSGVLVVIHFVCLIVYVWACGVWLGKGTYSARAFCHWNYSQSDCRSETPLRLNVIGRNSASSRNQADLSDFCPYLAINPCLDDTPGTYISTGKIRNVKEKST